MTRINGVCCGDCGRCELLKDGSVDMVPCVLDQIFRKMQRMEKELEALKREDKSVKILNDEEEE